MSTLPESYFELDFNETNGHRAQPVPFLDDEDIEELAQAHTPRLFGCNPRRVHRPFGEFQ